MSEHNDSQEPTEGDLDAIPEESLPEVDSVDDAADASEESSADETPAEESASEELDPLEAFQRELWAKPGDSTLR